MQVDALKAELKLIEEEARAGQAVLAALSWRKKVQQQLRDAGVIAEPYPQKDEQVEQQKLGTGRRSLDDIGVQFNVARNDVSVVEFPPGSLVSYQNGKGKRVYGVVANYDRIPAWAVGDGFKLWAWFETDLTGFWGSPSWVLKEKVRLEVSHR